MLDGTGSPPKQEVEWGQEQLGALYGAGGWVKGPARQWGMCSLPGISLAPQEKGWQSPRRLLSAHLAPGGAKGWLGSATGFSPASWGSWMRPGAASLPHARHRFPCSGWATALAWVIPSHGHGAKGSQGQEGAPGAVAHSPCSLPLPGMWGPAPDSTAATGAGQAERARGWGEVGWQWVACLVQRDSHCGCPSAPHTQPAKQDPASPHRQVPGLAAPKGRWGSQAVPPTLPQRDPSCLAPSTPGDLYPLLHPMPLGRG